MAGRIISMKNSNDTIGNRTRDLSACSAGPQPNALPRATKSMYEKIIISGHESHGSNKAHQLTLQKVPKFLDMPLGTA